MLKKSLPAIALSTFVVVMSALYGGGNYSYSLHGVTFESIAEFSSPEKAGVDALSMRYPKNAKQGKEKMSLTAVLYTATARKMMGMNDAGLLNYTRTAFMGVSRAGKPVERIFSGKKIRGDRVEKTIPVKATVEVYVIPLAEGACMGLGFSCDPAIPEEEAQGIIAHIIRTMKQ